MMEAENVRQFKVVLELQLKNSEIKIRGLHLKKNQDWRCILNALSFIIAFGSFFLILQSSVG